MGHLLPENMTLMPFAKKGGLKEKILPGKKVIGDNGYHGEPGIISTPNTEYCYSNNGLNIHTFYSPITQKMTMGGLRHH